MNLFLKQQQNKTQETQKNLFGDHQDSKPVETFLTQAVMSPVKPISYLTICMKPQTRKQKNQKTPSKIYLVPRFADKKVSDRSLDQKLRFAVFFVFVESSWLGGCAFLRNNWRVFSRRGFLSIFVLSNQVRPYFSFCSGTLCPTLLKHVTDTRAETKVVTCGERISAAVLGAVFHQKKVFRVLRCSYPWGAAAVLREKLGRGHRGYAWFP